MAKQTDKNLVHLSGDIEGSFYPSTQSELLRDVVLQSPFHIQGGVFAQNIKNSGGGIVTGPVLATAEITLKHPGPGKSALQFHSGISAALSIAVEEMGKSAGETVLADKNNASVVVRGDVLSDMVKLENVLVFGNVRARQAVIVNSIIVGSILIEEELRIENCLFVALSGGRVVLRGQNGCWLPYATSLEPMVFEETALKKGEKAPAELRYLALCRTSSLGCGFTLGGISCKPFADRQCTYRNVRLGPADIRPHKTGDGRTLYALNIAQRALDLAPIEQEIKQVETFLKELLIYEHLDKSSQEYAREQWAEKFKADERELLEQSLPMM